MLKQRWRLAAGWLAVFACLTMASSSRAHGQGVTAVSTFDLNRYMGVWFQVARLPVKAQKRCVSDDMVLYALGDKSNSFQVGISCQQKNGAPDTWDMAGKMDKKTMDGRLKLSHLVLFSTKYWVLATGPNYEWALVGSPNHKTLWVLSRTVSLDPQIVTQIEAKASAEGFNTAKLKTITHTQQQQ